MSISCDYQADGALLEALRAHDRGEQLTDRQIDRACDDLDARCRRGEHYRIEADRCVWCCREVAS